jgi:crotonobetainyl-CoA:carnitine CoA-transferase CaiB-like acyl-CoA transferase
VVGNPLKFRGAPERGHRYPPRLGEHSRAVLAEVLGMGDDEIARLVADGVVREPDNLQKEGKK